MQAKPLAAALALLALAVPCLPARAGDEIWPAYRFQAGDVHVFTGEAGAKMSIQFGETKKENENRFKLDSRAFLLSFDRSGARFGVRERTEKQSEKGSEVRDQWTLGKLDNKGAWTPEGEFAKSDKQVITGKNVLSPVRFPGEALEAGSTWKSPFSGLNLLNAPMNPLEVECTLVAVEGEGDDREILVRVNIECLEPEFTTADGKPHSMKVKTEETSEIAFRFHLAKGRVTRYSMRLVFTMSGQGMDARGDLTLELGLDSVNGGASGPRCAEAVSKALAVAEGGDREKAAGLLRGAAGDGETSPWTDFTRRLLEQDRFKTVRPPGEEKGG